VALCVATANFVTALLAARYAILVPADREAVLRTGGPIRTALPSRQARPPEGGVGGTLGIAERVDADASEGARFSGGHAAMTARPPGDPRARPPGTDSLGEDRNNAGSKACVSRPTRRDMWERASGRGVPRRDWRQSRAASLEATRLLDRGAGGRTEVTDDGGVDDMRTLERLVPSGCRTSTRLAWPRGGYDGTKIRLPGDGGTGFAAEQPAGPDRG